MSSGYESYLKIRQSINVCGGGGQKSYQECFKSMLSTRCHLGLLSLEKHRIICTSFFFSRKNICENIDLNIIIRFVG